jgi:adenosine deaminase
LITEWMDMDRDLVRLPKAHLHLHLTGSMRPATLRELALRHGVAGADWSGPLGTDWSSFQRRYDAARSTIRTADDLHRVILEAAQDDLADGSVWLELQASPAGIGRQFGLGYEGAIELLLQGCQRAREHTGLGIGLIVAANWTRPPEEAKRIAAAAARYAGHGVVGFGISDDERGTDPARWRGAFSIAADAGLLATPHSGFYAGPHHIRACLSELRADRIGHGVTAVRDAGLLETLAETGTTIELCPTSYPPLGVVDGLDAVPLRRFREYGVPVALGADDPLVFGSGLADQYRIARDVLGFADAQLADLARSSIRGSAAPDKRASLTDVDRWMAAGAA